MTFVGEEEAPVFYQAAQQVEEVPDLPTEVGKWESADAPDENAGLEAVRGFQLLDRTDGDRRSGNRRSDDNHRPDKDHRDDRRDSRNRDRDSRRGGGNYWGGPNQRWAPRRTNWRAQLHLWNRGWRAGY